MALPPLDGNGDFSLEGLEPGDYQIEIKDRRGRRFDGPKSVKLVKDAEASVSFALDANRMVER
jgi:hypothetical protein